MGALRLTRTYKYAWSKAGTDHAGQIQSKSQEHGEKSPSQKNQKKVKKYLDIQILSLTLHTERTNKTFGVMKTIREIRLEMLIQTARENVANSENAILKIYDSFVDGQIPANRAKKEYKKILPAFLTDLNRYNYLRLSLRSDTNVSNEDPEFWANYYNSIFA